MEIVLSQIKKRFGDLQAVKTLSFTVKQGEFVSLLGPSGCGKTTLLRMLAGIETPDSGEIAFGDTVIFSSEKNIMMPPQKRNIGMVFQDFALWPHMTVFENVAYSLRARKQKKQLQEKVMEALRSVQLEPLWERYPHQLSGGQQQRVAFARAIVNKPGIILLDEPLSALDATLRDDMRLLLQRLVKRMGMTAIYVTHDQSEAMAMSDRIVVMTKGEVIQMDTPEMIYHYPVNETVARFVGKGSIVTGTPCTQLGQSGFQLGQEAFLAARQAALFPQGKEVQTVIRPETVDVSLQQSDHRVTGKVETISYLGERYEGTLKIANTDVVLHFYSTKRIETGTTVYVRIHSDQIHVLQSKGGAYETA